MNLTFGFRYELNTPFIDETNQLGNFNTDYPGGQLIYNPGEKINKLWAQAVGNTPFVANTSQVGLPEGLRFLDKSNFQPRLGVSYKPLKNNDGVLKASVGSYSVPVLGAVLYSLLGVDTSYYGVYASTAADPLNFSNVFTGSAGVAPYPGYRRANQFNLKDPRVIQYNAQFEENLGYKILGRVSYIGSHTYDLIYSPDLNQRPANTDGLGGTGSSTFPTTYTTRATLLRFPNFNEVLTRANGPSDRYNALILEANRRFSQGLSFTSAYTLTSNKTNALGAVPTGAVPVGASGSGDNGNNVLDYFNIKSDRGDAFYDPRHKLLATAVYDLPVGRGQKYLGNVNSIGNLLVGGWSTTGIFLFHTGNFMTPYFPSSVADPSDTNPSERSVARQRPDCVSTGGDAHTIASFFNAANYQVPANNIGRFGNCGVGILTGPKTTTLSMSAGKNFAITERFVVRYEAQFSNLFNITNWGNPNTNVTSSGFGQITSSAPFNNGALSGPRTIQMSLRVKF